MFACCQLCAVMRKPSAHAFKLAMGVIAWLRDNQDNLAGLYYILLWTPDGKHGNHWLRASVRLNFPSKREARRAKALGMPAAH